jgi:hypothetical protein
MSRKSRFVLPGVPQHVVQRAYNREPCFFADTNYERYLHDIHAAAVRNRLQIHAYVLNDQSRAFTAHARKPLRSHPYGIKMNPVRAGMVQHPGQPPDRAFRQAGDPARNTVYTQ